ncbi:SusD/RagB family nutrient-binding outer membrane lipoprotein [Pedobacter gandavensis]|uniref:SusD/RagB family nutrient-binding outer membrane lipoprotein n=1 Tax=Pedobacter gandavensis TaxID=2679963 RepID=A0ABR6EXT1_9SPHI|nr:SusD/RagB family nutrient-binding outer membrane lipoprotein [Pedobacter gandavensis]MBB2150090.1 SusD/RagB family nutrient-binding outer membrane lipoprotein [Pedobacter gandavensis]
MKKNYKYIFGLLFVSALFSCKKQLDINNNPNSPTEATPNRVLPQAIVATANNLSQFNFYGGQVVGYFANGGGVSGWGSIISYDYQTSEFNALWSNTYDILTDVKYVLDKSEGDATLKEFNAAAKVLKAYNFELLVDTYNDIPYTEANQGLDKIQPKYDKATDIYKNLADLCDQAIVSFKSVTAGSPAFVAADPMYGGNVTKWAKLANTIKLKLILKGRGKVTFSNTTFDPIGFVTDAATPSTDATAPLDVLVNPGYTQIDGKQNTTYNRWAYLASGAVVSAASNYALTPYVLGFYDGSKILDAARRAVTFNTSAVNQLGYQLSDAGRGASPSSWYVKGIGILKGPDAASPIMLAAESYFLQAEANVVGLIPGTAKDNFNEGMIAAFRYLYLNSAGTLVAGKSPTGDVTAYIAANVTKPNVNFSLATTDAQKLEAIITQKYLAFNMFFGHEAWNEFRRTGYPVTLSNGNPSQTFVSIVSQATTANKLPTRILYPLSEFKYNESNIPAVDKFSSKIFWAK